MSVDEPAAEARQTLATALGLKGPDALFPWQETLLSEMLAGDIRPSLDIPTGLGKTAAMAIWLVARAWDAPLPRRLIYVVDRRAVVDQATNVAAELRDFVQETPEIKQRLGLGDRSLPISTLRGQHVDNREWLEDPAVPAIIVGTVDMIGSRLLFEGYGVTRTMRPYHAALLGVDTLLVLDEAHLVPPFEELLKGIAHSRQELGPRGEEQQRLIPSFRLMSLSATGRASRDTALRLGARDFEHEEERRRLYAAKHVRLRSLQPSDDFTEALADAAWGLTGNGKRPVRCIVFCDRRTDAEKCSEATGKRAKQNGGAAVEVDLELFVGARRVRERQDAAKRLESFGFLAGKKTERTRPAFLFATSAAEVGVDLDADCMACDLVAWERMVQRLGRVNRRGDVHNGAEIVVIDRTPAAEDDAQQGAAHARREAIELLPRVDDAMDAGPAAILGLSEKAAEDKAIANTLDQATTPDPLRPELTRALVEAWAMTSLEDHPARPDVEPWLRGWTEDEPQTRIVWRTHMPTRTVGPEPTTSEIEGFFEAAPPQTSEVLETVTRGVLSWLEARAKVLSARAELDAGLEGSLPQVDTVVAVALTKAGGLRRTLRLRDLIPGGNKSQRRKELAAELAGVTMVVDARMGGLRDGLLEPGSDAIPRTADDGEPWMEVPASDWKASPPTIRFRVRSVEVEEQVPIDRSWRERRRFATAMSEEGEATRWLIVEGWRHYAADEEGRSVTRPELLEEHKRRVEEHARRLAKSLHLSDVHANMLAWAARLHDEGKATLRWQQAFNAPTDKQEVYAKTAGPVNLSRLDGYRHELGSILRVEEDQELLAELDCDSRDLGLHLIAAHHGFARPFIRVQPSMLEERREQIALRYARLQERWGPWGLAWWEALLRAADQQASRAGADPAERDGADA